MPAPRDRSITLKTPRLGTLVLAIALPAAQGCGDSAAPAPPAVVAAIEITAGDGQDGPAQGSPPVPLLVTLRGENGLPLAGGRVTWSVASGDATLSAATSTSDANGRATTGVTLGPPGDVAIEATAGALAPVTFQLHALDPCGYLAPFRLDTAVTGALAAVDCALPDGSYVDFYRFTSSGQQAVRVTMRAAAFDAFLYFYAFSGAVVALVDEGGGGTDASFKAIVPAGTFVVGANSLHPEQVGAYTLTATGTALTVADCDDVWLVGPAAFSETIEASDCPGPYYADRLMLVLEPERTLTVTQTSLAVNPYLRLYRVSGGALVAEAGATTAGSATLSYMASALDVYVLEVTTAIAGQTGDYTLSVAGFTPAPPARGYAAWAPPIIRDRHGRSAPPPRGAP